MSTFNKYPAPNDEGTGTLWGDSRSHFSQRGRQITKTILTLWPLEPPHQSFLPIYLYTQLTVYIVYIKYVYATAVYVLVPILLVSIIKYYPLLYVFKGTVTWGFCSLESIVARLNPQNISLFLPRCFFLLVTSGKWWLEVTGNFRVSIFRKRKQCKRKTQLLGNDIKTFQSRYPDIELQIKTQWFLLFFTFQ